MMKVRFLKDHLDNVEGDVVTVDEDRANYWVLMGVAEEAKEKKVHTPEKEKNDKPQHTSKNKK